jgi:hypothetical protein
VELVRECIPCLRRDAFTYPIPVEQKENKCVLGASADALGRLYSQVVTLYACGKGSPRGDVRWSGCDNMPQVDGENSA